MTNARGFVLFTFPKERRSIALCMRTPSCMSDWPPVLTAGAPIAGPGLNATLLGTIPYKGALRVVTYAGWPLHTYRFAYSAQASVINIGITQFGGRWVALNAAGRLVR